MNWGFKILADPNHDDDDNPELLLMVSKTSTRGQSFRCPFPGCASDDENQNQTCVQLPGLKWCECLCCGRISSRCIFEDCTGVNRAFSRFCVHCGRSLWDTDSPVRVDDLWRAASLPADLFQRSSLRTTDDLVPLHGKSTHEAPVVATLDSRMFPPRKELISWSIVDGVLLLHQGGGGIAAIYAYVNHNQEELTPNKHASGNSAASENLDEEELKGLNRAKSPFWSVTERTAFPAPDRWRTKTLPHLNLEFGRPYQPVVTGDHRFALLSAPYGAAVMPLNNLPGWSAQPAVGLISLVRLGNQQIPKWTLAAAPIPIQQHNLDGKVEWAIGLLICNRPDGDSSNPAKLQYFWRVIDLSPDIDQREPLTSTLLESTNATPLPVKGGVCQVIHMSGGVASSESGLLFATPLGIWISRISFETRHNPLVASQIRAENESFVLDNLRLNAEVESRNRFRWDRLLTAAGNESLDELQLVAWYANFRESGESTYNVLSFSWPTETESEVMASALSVSNLPVAPVGIGRNSGTRNAFFLTADRGELFSHQIGEQPKPEHRAFMTKMDELIGITLCDPLVIAVRRSRTERLDAEKEDFISVRSLRTPELPPLNFGPFRLESDPIYWMGGIYFCERLQDRLAVRRIDLKKSINPIILEPKTGGTP